MPISVRLPEETVKRLDILVARTGRSKTFYIREAIEAHLENLEDVFLAEEALEKFRKSGRKGVPLADIKKRLGRLEDLEDTKLARERADGPFVEMNINDL